MNYIKKFTDVGLSILLGAAALTGCGASDKSAVKEASEGFMEAIKNSDKDGINT